jgi:homoserine kinase
MTGPASVNAFAPASVSNLACGFDVLGVALAEPGDRVTARRGETPGVHLTSVTGDGGRLPRDAESNTAGVAARALLAAAGEPATPVELELEKGMPLASGLGSSAASAAAAVVAVDALLGLGSSPEALLAAALEGERASSGAAHADNAAPSLYGGFVLIRSTVPLDVVALRVPPELALAVIHPDLEISTREARDLLPRTLPLAAAVTQWGNLGALVAGLHQADWGLVSRALVDVVAEPVRSPLVPGFAAMRRAALAAGALGANLSGSGPSLFALCRGPDTAGRAAEAMAEAWRETTGKGCQTYVSAARAPGARVVGTEGQPR